MRRRNPAAGAEYRAEFAARLRRQADLGQRILRELEGGPELLEAAERGEAVEARGPVGRRALAMLEGLRRAELEAGEPVAVRASELPAKHPAYGGEESYTLEPDGSLTAQG